MEYVKELFEAFASRARSHFFGSIAISFLALNEMVERIFTRKVQVEDADGNLVTEVKGSIWEVEVGPNQIVEWYFVPVQTMDETEITCELPGHYEAGMFATVVIN